MSSCVLCSTVIVKNSDKNLVLGRAEFKVSDELLSLDFPVILNSPYICRNCIGRLKKRRALITNLREANATLLKIYSSAVNVNAKRKDSSCSRGLFTKRVALGDARPQASPNSEDTCPVSTVTQRPSCSPGTRVQLPQTTSTPTNKERSLNPPIPLNVSPIFRHDGHNAEFYAQPLACASPKGNKKTTVQVRVEWPSKTKVNTLHEGLEALGKMLCRGTYKQIAAAVWKNPVLKKHVQQHFLKEVDRECTVLCSLKNKSCLRSPSKDDLKDFTFKKLNNELETQAPLFSAVLWTASMRQSKREDAFWLPALCMSAAVLLKNRSPCMNAIQLLNTIVLYHSGIIVSKCVCLMISFKRRLLNVYHKISNSVLYILLSQITSELQGFCFEKCHLDSIIMSRIK